MIRRSFTRALVLLLVLAASASAREWRPFNEAQCDGAKLRYINDLPVLSVGGSPEEIGRQKAELTGGPAKAMIELPVQMFKMAGAENHLSAFLERCRLLLPQFPADHAAEFHAFVARSGAPEDLSIAGNTLMDVYRDRWGCSSLIVESSRSQTGKPLFARNLDFPSFGILDRYNLVTAYAPEGKHKFVAVGWPGLVGVLSGMNDAGLCLAVHNVYKAADDSPMFNAKGMPYTLCFRRMLEECTTVAQAEKLLRESPRTTKLSLGICDLTSAAVFELTPKTVAVRRAEGGMISCTNHFRTAPLSVGKSCWRFDQLEKGRNERRLSVDQLEKKLHEVNQAVVTVQSMVFEPGAMKLHLSIGRPPVSGGPYRELDVQRLFEGE